MAGSAPAISAISTRKALFISPAAPPTCTYPADPTSTRARWRRKSSPIGEEAVLGVPDPFWGEVGVAVCVAREGAGAVTELELAKFLVTKVSRYKMPNRICFWDALPKSGYGRVPKRLVRDELEARGLLDTKAC